MNILILNWKDIKNPEVGGAEVIAFEFAKRLVKEGHTVTFFCRQFVGGNNEEYIDGVHIVRQGNRYSVYFRGYLYYRSLSVKPDLVIDMVNTLCWMTPFYVPRSKRLLYVNQLAKEVLFYELSKPFSLIAYLFERLEYLPYKTTRTVCYSESTKNDLVSFGIPLRNINTFPLGLDHDRYFPGKKAAYPLIIFVARLVRMKRADLCIKAMKEIVKINKSARLVILGNGPEEDNLAAMIKKMRITKYVQIIGKNNFYNKKNPRDVKVKYMQKAWALILPSVKEGWGMVVTEAAACKTLSIVTDVTGLRDSVRRDTTGLVLSKNPTVKEISDSIKTIITDKTLRERLSMGAVTWSRNFSWNKSYNKFRQIILLYEK